MNSLPDIIFIYNNQGDFLDYYVQNDEFLLQPPQKSLGKNISDILSGDSGEKAMRAFKRAVDDGQNANRRTGFFFWTLVGGSLRSGFF